MSLFRQAASLNNLGIESLLIGDYQQSIESFARSIKAFKAGIQSRPSQKTGPTSTSSAETWFRTAELSFPKKAQ